MASDAAYLRKLGLEVSSFAPSHIFSRSSASGGVPVPAAAATAAAPIAKGAAKAAPASTFGSDLFGKGFAGEAVSRGSHPPWLVPNTGHDVKLQVANSLTGAKETFRPLNGKKVVWYTCGPTVYDVAHMGHARAYLTFDILRRIMSNYLGYDVKYHINITDIDDKIILRSRQNKLFDDFRKEAAKMKLAELQAAAEAALSMGEEKLKNKAPAAPGKDASAKDTLEYETLKQEHALKMGQHVALAKKVEEALAAGRADAVLDAGRDVFMTKLDKERGHTVTDHSIFDAHARKYEDSYFNDMDSLGVLRPDVVTRITTYMDGRVQKYIERLEELGVAYGSLGSVYFDIDAFQKLGYHYRKLVPAMCASAKEMEEGEGALAADDAEKRNPNDFALWKKSKPGEPAWESKWGPGRPGWHIECSVMACDINGDHLDIHAGGEDLKFPHHDNEMAQSEAYLQRSQWVNYFWHAGHLHIEGLKMSKSLKNFITIGQALEMHSARQLRLMFLLQAWDKGMNYSDQAIDMAKAEERKMKHFLGSLGFWSRQPNGQQPGDREANLEASVASTKDAIHAAILDNFSTPRVVEATSKLISECQVLLLALPEASLVPVLKAAELISNIMCVFGVEGLTAEPEGPKDAWISAVDALSGLRVEIREIARKKGDAAQIVAAVDKLSPAIAAAKKANLAVAGVMESFQKDLKAIANDKAAPADLLKRCDALRNVELVQLGIRLEDRDGVSGIPYLWMFDDRKAMEAEQREVEEKKKEEAQSKIRNKLDQKQKELKSAEKAAVEPQNLFRSAGYAGMYSEFDAEGVPTKQSSGEEISAKKKKDFVKELGKQQKDYEKLQKQAGDDIAAFLDKMRKEVADMEAQMNA
mmetsp:Transcript_51864/g.133990  ORF Transcript_51864/g.133990 Transcript_51864/m.133990 type:complete len:868 (-) Transcript_51864:71-2674(-)